MNAKRLIHGAEKGLLVLVLAAFLGVVNPAVASATETHVCNSRDYELYEVRLEGGRERLVMIGECTVTTCFVFVNGEHTETYSIDSCTWYG